MAKRIDLTGQRFGKYVVVQFAEKRKNVFYWVCLCDCGNTKEVQGAHLRHRHNQSCGCFRTTHCARGHEYTQENTRFHRKHKHRICITCANEDSRKQREKGTARNNKRQLKQQLVGYKGTCCADCKGVFPQCCYHFDHRDPSTKTFTIGKMLHRPIEELKEELDKCDLVCANCHAIRTFGNEEIGKKMSKGQLAASAMR